VLGANVFVAEPLSLLGRVRQYGLTFVRKREVDRSRYLFADGGVRLDLLPNRFDRSVRAQEAVGQRFVFAQKAEQQVFGLDIRRAELTGLITGEEDHTSRLLRIAFEHAFLPCQGYRPKSPSGSVPGLGSSGACPCFDYAAGAPCKNESCSEQPVAG